jgi:hypothetical protein
MPSTPNLQKPPVPDQSLDDHFEDRQGLPGKFGVAKVPDAFLAVGHLIIRRHIYGDLPT